MKIPRYFLYCAVIAVLASVLLIFSSCSRTQRTERTAAQFSTPSQTLNLEDFPGDREVFIDDFWGWIFSDAGLPDELARKTVASLNEGPDFMMELLEILSGDPSLYILVDKSHALASDYVPPDLTELGGGSYQVTRSDMTLRRPAAESLETMAAAARADGVTLTAASTYRSFNYQHEVYNRHVANMGQEAADRVSARPGHSQHQLGLIVDFNPISDAFAGTPAGVWMHNNASRFGWSLSYPQGFEDVTGYSWESWHYRYVGTELAAFIDKYFNGIQQYALQFIQAWIESS